MEVSPQIEAVLQQHESPTFAERKETHAFSEEVQQTHKSRLSFWHYLREVLEATLALGIISGVGIFLPSLWLQPHLIFCVVFLLIFVVAIRYHVVTTYTVGLLVAGWYSLLLWQQSQTNPSFDVFQLFIEPFVLFVSGVVVSEMLRMRRRQLELTGQQRVQKEKFLQDLKQRYQDIYARNVELEQHVVGQAVSVSMVSEMMAHLWRLRGQALYNAILDLVMHAMNAKFCALYMLHEGHLSLCASQKQETSKYVITVRLKLDAKDALIRRTMQSRQVCTVRDTLTESRSTQPTIGLMAGPLVDHRNQIVGVIIVDDIPLLKFLPTTVRLFGSLLHMISIAVQTMMPAADVKPAVSLPFVPGTEVDAVQTAMSKTNRDAIEDGRVTQLWTERMLPSIRIPYRPPQ